MPRFVICQRIVLNISDTIEAKDAEEAHEKLSLRISDAVPFIEGADGVCDITSIEPTGEEELK